MTDEHRTSIAIVMPAYHWGSIPKSHCTVAFLGDIHEVDYTKEQVQKLVHRLGQLDLWLPNLRINTHSVGYDMFGVDKDKPVALLHRDEKIMEVRERAEELLNEYAIDYSNMWEYTPHVSLFEGSKMNMDIMVKNNIEMRVMLRPPVLWWGDDRGSTVVDQYNFYV